MCGILGGVAPEGKPECDSVYAAALNLIRHRGPDGGIVWRKGEASLGHRRLAVIDPQPRSDQPFCLDDLVLVFNGEIYNFVEIRERLVGLGHQFVTSSDTEVVLVAWRQWGSGCLNLFEGMFAFAIWDCTQRKLILARDRYGEKPLYYSADSNRVHFASEIQSLVALLSEPPAVSQKSIGLYLSLSYIPAPATIYSSIELLPPGCWLEWQKNSCSQPQRYYSLQGSLHSEVTSPADYQDAQLRLHELINSAVKLRLEASDVPVATFLSGGLDSSIVTSLAARHSSGRLPAYSLSFPSDKAFDEVQYARKVAERHSNIDHHVVEADEQMILDYADDMLNRLGEPFADASLLPSGLLCSQITQKVVLGGDGADEVFAGYGVYPAINAGRALPRTLGAIAELIPPVRAPASIRNPLLRSLALAHKNYRKSPRDSYFSWRRYADPTMLADLGVDLSGFDEISQSYDDFSMDTLTDIQVIDITFNLPNDMLRKVDYASMAHGIEVRLPYLDSDLLHWTLSMPEKFRLHGRRRKRILRDALAHLLPAEIIRRGKKGFLLPIRDWLSTGRTGANLRELMMSQTSFDREKLNALLTAHCEKRADNSELLWAFYVLFKWQTALSGIGTSARDVAVRQSELSDGARILRFE